MNALRIPLLLAASLAAVPAAVTAQQQDVVWNTQGVTKNEVVLGMHTDLSGVAASFGVPVANVARLRVEQVNAAGGIHGRKLRLVIEDNGYQVPRAVQAANKLINSDKVFAMIGAAGTPMNNAALPAQLKAGVPNLFPVSWARAMAEPLHPLKFVLYASYPDQIRGAVKWFVETRGKKRICSMYQDTDFGREIHGGALAQVRLLGLELAGCARRSATWSPWARSCATRSSRIRRRARSAGTTSTSSVPPRATIWRSPERRAVRPRATTRSACSTCPTRRRWLRRRRRS
jgi:branched-chain amino acid transport system substrate-binding protein